MGMFTCSVHSHLVVVQCIINPSKFQICIHFEPKGLSPSYLGAKFALIWARQLINQHHEHQQCRATKIEAGKAPKCHETKRCGFLFVRFFSVPSCRPKTPEPTPCRPLSGVKDCRDTQLQPGEPPTSRPHHGFECGSLMKHMQFSPQGG